MTFNEAKEQLALTEDIPSLRLISLIDIGSKARSRFHALCTHSSTRDGTVIVMMEFINWDEGETYWAEYQSMYLTKEDLAACQAILT